jgi:hypothetical protein
MPGPASTVIADAGRRAWNGVDETRFLHATTHAFANAGAQPRQAIQTRAAWSCDPFLGPAARTRAARIEVK